MQLHLVAGPLKRRPAAAARICAVMTENDRSSLRNHGFFDGQRLSFRSDDARADAGHGPPNPRPNKRGTSPKTGRRRWSRSRKKKAGDDVVHFVVDLVDVRPQELAIIFSSRQGRYAPVFSPVF